MTKKLINIYAAARSGSTMVDLILGNDRRGFSLGEVCHWFYPMRTHHFDIKCGCGEYPCPVWDRIRHFPKQQFHRAVLDELGVDFLVDSSKDIPWIIDNNAWARAGGYAALNLLLYKEPVSLYYSYWKRSNRALDRTARSYRGYAAFMRTGLPYLSVSYDALVREPETVLKRLCGLLGIPYYEGKHRFWDKAHHHLFGSAGVRRQLASPGEGIYAESYAEAFEAERGDIEQAIRRRPEIGGVVSRLQEADVMKASRYPVAGHAPVRKGRLYYQNRLISFVRRYFPERHADKEAAFIRGHGA